MIADRAANPIRTARSSRIVRRWLVAPVVFGSVLTGCGSVASVPSTTVDASEPLPSTSAAPSSTTTPAPTSTVGGLLVTGVGEESLIVVIHSVWADGEEPSPGLEAFGDMQGFYFDLATNYAVLGAYVQQTPDYSTESGGSRESVPVELEHVELAALEAELADNAECGREDLRPCPNPALLAFVANGFRFDGGSTLALSGFRTKAGAEGFIEMARAFGLEGLFALRVEKTGGGLIGLGQEEHPDGSGPLLGPLPNIDDQF
jgi:hypothetical protein